MRQWLPIVCAPSLHGAVELQRTPARRRLGAAEHDADLHTYLINEHDGRAGLGNDSRKLAQCTRHKPRLHADALVAHLAFNLRARHERRHGVHNDNVQRAGAHKRFDDVQGLLAGVGLVDQKILDIHAELARILRIECMFGVDERGDAALLLGLRDHVQRQRRLARRLRPVDLKDTPARDTADAERDVERRRAG